MRILTGLPHGSSCFHPQNSSFSFLSHTEAVRSERCLTPPTASSIPFETEAHLLPVKLLPYPPTVLEYPFSLSCGRSLRRSFHVILFSQRLPVEYSAALAACAGVFFGVCETETERDNMTEALKVPIFGVERGTAFLGARSSSSFSGKSCHPCSRLSSFLGTLNNHKASSSTY